MLRNRMILGMNGNCKCGLSIELDEQGLLSFDKMFGTASWGNIISINMSGLKKDNVYSINSPFSGCTSLTDLDLSNWNISKNALSGNFTHTLLNGCTNLKNFTMKNIKLVFGSNGVNNGITYFTSGLLNYSNTPNLTRIDLSNWDFSDVGYSGDTLSYASANTFSFGSASQFTNTTLIANNWKLPEISNFFVSRMNVGNLGYSSKILNKNFCKSLSTWDVSNVTYMNYMFYRVSNISSLDLTNWDISNVTNMNGMFWGCSSLNEIKMGGKPNNSLRADVLMFYEIALKGIFYYNPQYDYSKIIRLLPNTWTATPMGDNIKCVNLNIVGEDVPGRATTTNLSYVATITANSVTDGSPISWIESGRTISSEFTQNTSETESRQVEISFTYKDVTATTTITQGIWKNQYYTVDLNSQWQLSSTISNPDLSTYDGVYESFSNKGIYGSAAIAYIDIVGYETFKLYVRSDAYSTSDFVVVSNLDCTLTSETTSGSNVKMTTSGNQQSGTAIGNYTLVEFNGIDGGEHRISVMYRKYCCSHSGKDQGYLLIPKNQ